MINFFDDPSDYMTFNDIHGDLPIPTEDRGIEDQKFKVTRTYTGMMKEEFDFTSMQDAINFVQDRIREMRYTIRGIGLNMNDLQCSQLQSLSGSLVWSVSMPKSLRYKNVANTFCIFRLEKVEL